MDISVVLCAYNGAASLGGALASFKQLSIPGELSWELILSEFEGLLEEINRRPVRPLLVVHPSQSVGCIRRIRHATTRRLSKRECYIHITAGLKHHVGEVI